MLKVFAVSFCLIILSYATVAQTINNTKSEVRFSVSNMGFNTVDGTFGNMSGQVSFNPENIAEAYFEVCVDATTVDTEHNKRDEHLRKEDFFYVEQFPAICFVSENISKTSIGYVANGTLTMRGVSKAVAIPFTFGNKRFDGNFTINRRDFELGPSGGFMVGKEVALRIICTVD